MPRVRKRSALQVLNRTRLEALIKRFDLDLPSRSRKGEMIETLTRTRRASLEDLLGTLRRDELKVICREHDLDDSGRARRGLIDRLLGRAEAGPSRGARSGREGKSTVQGRCDTCKRLGEQTTIDTWDGPLRSWPWHHKGEKFPGGVEAFKVIKKLGKPWEDDPGIRQCPVCGTHFEYTTDDDNEVGDAINLEILTRISVSRVQEILDRKRRKAGKKRSR